MRNARYLFLLVCLSIPSMSLATENFSEVSCIYGYDGKQWFPWQMNYNEVPEVLAAGSRRLATAGWTGGNEKVGARNYAVCSEYIGTVSDDIVKMNTFVYSANNFDPMTGADCTLTGDDVQLVSKASGEVKRGGFVTIDTTWSPPQMPKIQIREYFRTHDELNMSKDQLWDLCDKIGPTN